MKIQQLKYILALDEHRHFVKAADACGVSQSTLSAMIQKFEEELDIQIFDRNVHPIQPTIIGQVVIDQARDIIARISYVKESVLRDKMSEFGEIKMGILPTIAPYIVPAFIAKIAATKVKIKLFELTTEPIVEQLINGKLDCALLTTPLHEKDLLEIPIYYEKFMAYGVDGDEVLVAVKGEEEQLLKIDSKKMSSKNLWLLQEGHCFRMQTLAFCGQERNDQLIYEAGSITTLVDIVDNNGGITVIPELHQKLLSSAQTKKVREIIDPTPVREISMLIRKDFIRERILNIIIDAVKEVVPHYMLNERLKKFCVRL